MIEIDFEALKYADLEVVNVEPTPEELRAFSEFLKKHREKQDRLEAAKTRSSMKAQPLESAKRKNIRAAAK
jgi:hypothetical protein